MNKKSVQIVRTAARTSPLVVLVVLMLVTAACRLGENLGGAPDSTPTMAWVVELATQTQLAADVIPSTVAPTRTPTATNTPAPPTSTLSPSPTTGFTLTPLSTSKIKFFRGGTMTYIEQDIRGGQEHPFTFKAMKGQTVILTITSPENDVYFSLKRMDTGQNLVSASQETSEWTGTLPVTGSYSLDIFTDNPDSYYVLKLEIPANVYFARGAYSKTMYGHIEVFDQFHPDMYTRVRYLADARGGQKMIVTLTSTDLEGLSIGIVGQTDGETYARYQVKSTRFELELPSTQGYYVDVYSIDGDSKDFSLKIEIY